MNTSTLSKSFALLVLAGSLAGCANRYHVAVDRVVGNTNLYSSNNPKFQMLGPQSRKGRRPCKG